jgi:hypothetical protein
MEPDWTALVQAPRTVKVQLQLPLGFSATHRPPIDRAIK